METGRNHPSEREGKGNQESRQCLRQYRNEARLISVPLQRGEPEPIKQSKGDEEDQFLPDEGDGDDDKDDDLLENMSPEVREQIKKYGSCFSFDVYWLTNRILCQDEREETRGSVRATWG